MKLPSINYLLNAWSSAAKRFPLAVLITFIGTLCLMFIIHADGPDDYPSVFKMFLSCLVFFPFFICVTLVKEAYNWSPPKWIGLCVFLFLLMISYWQWMAPDSELYRHVRIVQFFIFLVISHLVVTFIPYLKNDNLSDFWEYNRTLFINFVVGGIYSVIIILGIFGAFAAISYLFDVDVDEKLYGYIAVFVAGVFHTGYFLSSFPKEYKHNVETVRHDKVYINLVKYVLISLVCLYLIILYAFGIKIIFSWELPKGFVASLVLGFSIVGILTYLLNYRLPEIEGSGWVKTYRKWFFYILVPLTSLLFVGILRRINEYGVTEERYFVFIAGLFLVAICLYFIISKRDDIRVIPMAITLCCLITGLGGPIGAFDISRKSQNSRLKLQLQTLDESKGDITNEDKKSLRSLVRYFTDRRYFKEFDGLVDGGSLDSLSNNEAYNKIINVLSLDYDAALGLKDGYISWHSKHYFIKSIDGYQYHLNVSNLNKYKNDNIDFGLGKVKGQTKLKVIEDGETVDTIDLTAFIESLKEEFGYRKFELDNDKMTLITEGKTYDYKLIFKSLEFPENIPDAMRLQCDLYWKEKENFND